MINLIIFLQKTFLFCIALLFGLYASSAQAAQYALLVGVSDYPSLPEARWLKGPGNDIDLLKEILKERGFQDKNVIVLADGIKGAELPTRRAILDALADLEKTVHTDDFVYFHLGGHGSQQPQLKTSEVIEPDGLDEIFLPYDIGKWDAQAGMVKNAITDDEIGAAITALRQKGAFVWAIFDTCHSGTMLRGAPVDDILYRKVGSAELGVPAKLLSSVQVSAKKHKEPAAAQRGGYVAFYAAQPHELTPEQYYPRGNKNSKCYGLFSYTIARILRTQQPMSYRQAAQRIFQSYTAQNVRMPTPLFEGNSLDSPLFGSQNSPLIHQWPIEATNGGWLIKAGILHQIEDGAIFALLNSPADKDTDALGYAIMTEALLNQGQLQPIDHAGLPKLNSHKVSRDAYARLILPKINFSITVALPDTEKDAGTKAAITRQFIKEFSEIDKPSAGITINWVKAGETADIRLGFSPTTETKCPRDRLWFLPPNGELICKGRHKTLSILFDKKKEDLQAALYKNLQSMGKVINLLRLAEQLATTNADLDVELSLSLRRKGMNSDLLITPEMYPDLQDGDHLLMQVANKGQEVIDLTILFVDSQFGIHPLYPKDGKTNRIEPNSSRTTVMDDSVSVQTVGTERLIVISAAAEPHSPNVDFSFLAQESLPATTRGDENRPGAEQTCSIECLFKEAGFGRETSRGAGKGRTKTTKTAITMFSWKVD